MKYLSCLAWLVLLIGTCQADEIEIGQVLPDVLVITKNVTYVNADGEKVNALVGYVCDKNGCEKVKFDVTIAH